jgi:hypothetical protein
MEMRYILRDRKSEALSSDFIRNRNYIHCDDLFVLDLYKIIVNYDLKGDITAIGKQIRDMFNMTREEYFNTLNGANIEFFEHFGIAKMYLKDKIFENGKKPRKYTKKRNSKFKIEEVLESEIQEYLDGKLKLKYFAHKYNSSPPTVSSVFRQNGIKIYMKKMSINDFTSEEIHT